MKKYVAALAAAAIIALAAHDLFAWVLPVQAAPPAIPDNCEEIAVIGSIHTYECEDLSGNPYLQNSMGFLAR